MLKGWQDNFTLVLLCLLNLALGLGYLFFFTDPLYAINHEATQLALSLVGGQGFVSAGGLHLKYAVSAILQPVYPCLLALLILAFKLPYAFLAMRLLQLLALVFLVILIYLIAREIFNKRAALVAAGLGSIYLPFINITTVIWDTTLFCLLVSLAVFLALKYENKFLYRGLLLGLVLGIAVLTNAVALILFPAIFVYLYWRYRPGGWRTIINLLLVLATAAALALPWSVRNMIVYRGFIPVRSGFWGVLYLANNRDATGTIWLKHDGRLPRDADEGITLHFRPLIGELASLNEYQQDQYFKAKFINYVTTRPLEFTRGLFVKLYYFLWANPFERTNDFWLAEYLFILLFGLGGLYHSWHEGKRVGLFVLIFLMFTGVYTIMGPLYNWKYRLPVEPFLIVLAGYGLTKLFTRFSKPESLQSRR
jgi:4-amino-4-deoxy-L-arabinose transferase-like glycosyltransferase